MRMKWLRISASNTWFTFLDTICKRQLLLGAGSCEEWMRRSLFAFPFHHRDAGPHFIVRHV
jgi:hypothetical protein